MKRHYLYEIDLERRTAFCTVCGHTEIYIPPTRTRTTPKVSCIKRASEHRLANQATQSRIREERRSQPDWKPRHSLSEINPEARTAICAICGPTDIRKITGKKYTRYDCVTKQRGYMREYRRSHYIGHSSNPHALSEIDEDKQTAVCAKCGPVKIEVWLGKKKINRRCINVTEELSQARPNRRKAKIHDETL